MTGPIPGNSLNSASPAALRLVLDSLRYWVRDCHVDGFRFDACNFHFHDPLFRNNPPARGKVPPV